jgi:Raf kinase inhibitor-like YbhB/YbcL family protein
MIIKSPVFQNNEFIPSNFTCDGAGANPELEFEEIPAEAKSLALIMEDPDSPVPNFTHWIIWNIGPKTKSIKEGEVPEGAAEGGNDARKTGYIGPCPNKGTHRYVFNLYALSDYIDLPAGSDKESLRNAIKDKILASARLIGIYKRQ